MPRIVRLALALFIIALILAVYVECIRLSDNGTRAEHVAIACTWVASAVAIMACFKQRMLACYLVAAVVAESMLWFRFHGDWLQKEGVYAVVAFAVSTVFRFGSLILLGQPAAREWLKRTAAPSGVRQERTSRVLQLACGLSLGLALTSLTPQSPWGGSYRLAAVSGMVGLILLARIVAKAARSDDT